MKLAKLSKFQKGLSRLFTLVETVVLTVWGVLEWLAFRSLEQFLATGEATSFGLFLFWEILSIVELYLGLQIEHNIAVSTGDYPLQGQIQPQPE